MNDVSRSAGRSPSTEMAGEIAVRFERDRAQIVADLLSGRDPGPVVAVEPEAGDRHQGGRSVALLRFADGDEPVVYKPRSVQAAALYNRLLAWLDARCPTLAPAAVPTLVRAGYGWSRFVTPKPCRSIDEVRRFYLRQGAVLALLHAADATDMHAENVIANGDQPRLIDTETLLHPVLDRTVLTGADPAVRAHENSVLRTLLLPTLMRGGPAAVDVSGLGGGSAAAPNRPTLDGEAPDPADHLPDLLSGFRQGYDAISHDAEAFCRELSGARRITTRFVARATRRYAEFLAAGAADLEPAGFEGAELLLDHERRDLAEGDIPIFFARPGSRALWSSRGERIDGVLAASGLESATAKVRAMNDEERRRQEWMIEAAFAARAGTVRHGCEVTGSAGSPEPTGDAATLDPQWAVDQAVGVARELSTLAYREGGRINWLGLEPLEDGHWTVLPTGLGLSHGYGGVALFLAQLGALTGRSEFSELAAGTLAVAPALVAALAELPGHLGAIGGGFDGMGGVAYALRRSSALLDSAELRQAAELAEELAARAEAGASPGGDLLAGGPAPQGDSEDVLDDSWCHGLAGRAAAGALEPSQLTGWLARLASAPILTDLTVCHGEFGVLEALTLLASTGDGLAVKAFRRRAARLPDAVDHGALFSGAPGATPTPGFLHGLAGVGYGLLRVASPSSVPSVLTRQAAL